MIAGDFLVVEAKIRKELENIERLEEELSGYGLFPRIQVSSVGGFAVEDTAVCRLIGSLLHDYYVALENIFKTVAKRIDGTAFSGDHWHRELLEQMSLEISGVRPPLIREETAVKLDQLRAFRHVFRNVYGFSLSATKLKELLTDLPAASAALKQDVGTFFRKMERLLLELDKPEK